MNKKTINNYQNNIKKSFFHNKIHTTNQFSLIYINNNINNRIIKAKIGRLNEEKVNDIIEKNLDY